MSQREGGELEYEARETKELKGRKELFTASVVKSRPKFASIVSYIESLEPQQNV